MVKKLLIAALLMICLALGVSGAELMDQSTFVMEEYSVPIGIVNQELYRTETGYEFKAELVMMVEFLGAQQAIRGYEEMVLDEDFAIVSYTALSEITDPPAVYEITADYSLAEPEVTIRAADMYGVTTETYVLEPGEKLYYVDTVFYKLAAEGLVPGSEHEFLLLDTNEYIPTYGYVVISEEGTYDVLGYEFQGYAALLHESGVDMYIYFDESGAMHYNTLPDFPGMLARRVDGAELDELEYYTVSLRTQEANLLISHPVRSIYSQILISGVDPDAVQLEDNRQQIISSTDAGVLVSISKDNRSFRGKYTLPIAEPELAPYLGADRYIDPNLDEIQMLSAGILAGEKDAWTAVQQLVDWVFGYIQGNLTMRTKTTAQIIADPAGDCNEYAVLFASLARAAGIPTRVAEGYRYQGGYWAAHMWNEVWLGEWIAVDPSHRQTAPDALLVKFLDDASVADIQVRHVPVFLSANLAIKQVDIFSRKSLIGLETGVMDQTYTNTDFAFSITIPDQWGFSEVYDQSFAAVDASQLANVVVELYTLPAGIDPYWLMEAQIEAVAAAFTGYEFYAPEEIAVFTIDGRDAVAASWGIGIDDMMLYQEMVLVIIDDMCYNIIFTIPAMLYDSFAVDFNQMLDSIVFY